MTTMPVLSLELVVADVGTAVSVRVDSRTGVEPASVGDPVEDGGTVEPADVAAVVAAPVTFAVDRLVLVAPPGAAAVVRPLLCDDADVRGTVVEDDVDGFEVGFGSAAPGGATDGGFPAPKAQPSTLPAFGWVPLAPTVLYDQEPPGDARQ
ncbi:MAG TPA: hypothetical protein VFL94_11460 [Actinomycetales bacterium]|nr:hypothetical protein [Actinomycetales bacterium]